VVRLARENSGWGYDRIVGALANLGHAVSDPTVGNIRRRQGIAPAPVRKPTTTWKKFIGSARGIDRTSGGHDFRQTLAIGENVHGRDSAADGIGSIRVDGQAARSLDVFGGLGKRRLFGVADAFGTGGLGLGHGLQVGDRFARHVGKSSVCGRKIQGLRLVLHGDVGLEARLAQGVEFRGSRTLFDSFHSGVNFGVSIRLLSAREILVALALNQRV
jgi:hypothetical protein